jgi:hypothetical protein
MRASAWQLSGTLVAGRGALGTAQPYRRELDAGRHALHRQHWYEAILIDFRLDACGLVLADPQAVAIEIITKGSFP